MVMEGTSTLPGERGVGPSASTRCASWLGSTLAPSVTPSLITPSTPPTAPRSPPPRSPPPTRTWISKYPSRARGRWGRRLPFKGEEWLPPPWSPPPPPFTIQAPSPPPDVGCGVLVCLTSLEIVPCDHSPFLHPLFVCANLHFSGGGGGGASRMVSPLVEHSPLQDSLSLWTMGRGEEEQKDLASG